MREAATVHRKQIGELLLRSLVRRVLDRLEVTRGDLNRHDRIGALHRAWVYVFTNHLIGDYYEFGVYGGQSLIQSYRAYANFIRWLRKETTSPENWRREVARAFLPDAEAVRFLRSDTFAGMPANSESTTIFPGGCFGTTVSAVADRCRAVGLVAPRVVLFEGLFTESRRSLLTDPALRPAAIINLDCDLYASAVDALTTCEPLIQDGTVLLCDDYQCFNASNGAGERRALREFCQRTGIEVEGWFPYPMVGQAFLCHVTSRDGDTPVAVR